MDKAAFLQAFDELLEINRGTTKESDALSSLTSWDSLAVLGFIAFVDHNFGKVLSPVDIMSAKTVGDLMGLVSSHINE